MKILIFLILLISTLVNSRPITPKKIKWAVNAGSDEDKRA
jgi:hypothetical protein